MRPRELLLISLLGVIVSAPLHAEGFAALVSPPRFELETKPGKTLRSVIEVTNRAATPAHYLIHTADWTLAQDFSVTFRDELQPDSCRPWVAIERPEVVVPAAGTLRYRFEVAVPANAPSGECRFAVMIEGADPAIVRGSSLNVPVAGRIGVIVYVLIGNGAPDLEVLGPAVATLNGQQVPMLRVHNGGNAHGRMSGFLTGTDAKGIHYDFTPTDLPILPGDEANVFLSPTRGDEDHPTLAFPVTVKGTLEWSGRRTEINQRFE